MSWSSKQQNTISRSSVEAECWPMSLSSLLELRWPLPKATIMLYDNVSVVYLLSNLVHHQRTKHIKIDLHFVCDCVAMEQIRVLHVPSSSQFANIFTKGLSIFVLVSTFDKLPMRLWGSVSIYSMCTMQGMFILI